MKRNGEKTQREEAQHFGIATSYYNGILNHKRIPGLRLAIRISKEKGIPLSSLRPDVVRMMKHELLDLL